MKIEDFLSDDSINNIYNTFKNVFAIRYNENAKKGNCYIGQLILKLI